MSADVSSRAVWTYWEDPPGGVRPTYLDLCLETVQRHAAPTEVRILTRHDAPQWLPDLDVDRWEALPAPNYRSDYVRSRILRRYGGVWVDIDTVALEPLSELLDAIDDTGMVCFGRELDRFFGGLCAAAPGSAFADAWAEGQDWTLSRVRDWATLPYAALAQDVTWAIARRLPWKSLPMERVAPVPWYQWRRFLSRWESPRRVLSARPVTVVLWNAVMAPALQDATRERLLASRMLLSRLLRIGLGHSTVETEEDLYTKLHVLSAARFSLAGQRMETTGRRTLEPRARR